MTELIINLIKKIIFLKNELIKQNRSNSL
jgi:hypothetical protein